MGLVFNAMEIDSGFLQLVGGWTGLLIFLAHWHIWYTVKFTRYCLTRHLQRLCWSYQEMTQELLFMGFLAEDHDNNS